MEEKTTMLTRAILKAHDRIHNAQRKAHDKYGHTPLMYETIDPRTAKKRDAAMQDMKSLIYEGTSDSVQKPAQEGESVHQIQRRIKFENRLKRPLQSEHNRLAGKPEMPTSFESGVGIE